MAFHIDPGTLDFELPEELIAQTPLPQREQARLLVINRKTGELSHRTFADIGDYLDSGDVLVINNAKVSKAKLVGKKESGGKVEVIFLEKLNGSGLWKALVRPILKDGVAFRVGSVSLSVESRLPSGEYALRVKEGDVEKALTSDGRLPLPPYIKRDDNDARHALDEKEYQTVYAAHEGSVAAPTAGLHFSQELLSKLKKKGIKVVEILLHVGWGTFRPIANNVYEHKMLEEKFEISAEALNELVSAKKDKRRIISVGTTSTRTLESLCEQQNGAPIKSATSLFIQPGFKFRWVDALVTNLHVPRSTPVALTAAFAGLSYLESAYAAAIQQKYRFFSYGDAMLVL